MGLFRKKTERISRSKNPESKRYRKDMARHLDKKQLKCVTVRDENGRESVIGREGDLLVRGDEFVVYASGKILMRCRIVDMSAWELLSLEGVVITAPDLDRDGEEHTLIAYYKYWRKMEN